jgi:hypothetical protein
MKVRIKKPTDTRQYPCWMIDTMDRFDGVVADLDMTAEYPAHGGFVFHKDWLTPVEPPSPPASVLSEASTVVDGPRRETYGHPKENHARTAAMWNGFLANKLKAPLTMRDVCWLNILQKASRDANANHRDNLVDTAGWARNAELVSD